MNIHTLNIVDGYLPSKVRGLVQEWGETHQTELLKMWKTKQFYQLKPLI
jgi:hypothetical protein